jgi:hypothetical protein
VVVFFYFVQGLVERYPEIFGDEHGYSSEHQASFARKWGSYSAIISLTNNDITKIGEVVALPLEQCLLLLAFRSDKGLVEDLIHNEMLAKAKLQ